MKRRWSFILALWVLMFAGPASVRAGDAHVNGVVRLQVVQDGNALSITLESSLDNLLGFEHAPRTTK